MSSYPDVHSMHACMRALQTRLTPAGSFATHVFSVHIHRAAGVVRLGGTGKPKSKEVQHHTMRYVAQATVREKVTRRDTKSADATLLGIKTASICVVLAMATGVAKAILAGPATRTPSATSTAVWIPPLGFTVRRLLARASCCASGRPVTLDSKLEFWVDRGKAKEG